MVLVGDVTKRIAILVDDMAGKKKLSNLLIKYFFPYRYMWNI
jgi:hypothetical protein